MHFCVTGSTGFIGTHLVRHLLEEGHQVHALVRGPSELEGLPVHPMLHIHRDKHNALLMERVLREHRVESVIHLASLFIAEHQPEQIESLVSSNIYYGTELLQATVDAGVGLFINTGTTWQHFHSESYRPVCLYAATKQAFEAILAYYVDSYPVKAATLELCDTYGLGDKRRKILGILIDAAKSGEPIGLSPGEQQIDLVHISDVIAAYSAVIGSVGKQPQHSHLKYQISSDQLLSIKELCGLVDDVTGKKVSAQWGQRAYRKREVMRPSRLLPHPPQWSPQIKLEDGIKMLVEHR